MSIQTPDFTSKADFKAQWLEFEEKRRSWLNPALCPPLSIVQDTGGRWWCSDGKKAWAYPQGPGSYMEAPLEILKIRAEGDEVWDE